MTKTMYIWVLLICGIFLFCTVTGLVSIDGRFTPRFSMIMSTIQGFQDKLLSPIRESFSRSADRIFFPKLFPDSGADLYVYGYNPNNLSVIRRATLFSKLEINASACKFVAVDQRMLAPGDLDLRYILFDRDGNFVQLICKPYENSQSLISLNLYEDHTADGVIISAKWTADDYLELVYNNTYGDQVSVRLSISEGVIMK